MSGTGQGSYVRLLGYLKPFLGLFTLSTVLTVLMTGLDVFSLVLVIPMLQNLTDLGVLIFLQAVLGFDNLLYISIESKRAPEDKQSWVRRTGILLAIVVATGRSLELAKSSS